MQVVLIKKLKTLGNPGELKEVKRGYAINFLIPEGFALPANKGFIKEAGIIAKKFNKSNTVDMSKMNDLIHEINGIELTIKEKASEKGVLFGSVKASDIVDALAKKISKSIDEDYIVLKEHIKKIGEYDIEVKAGDAKGKIKVVIEAVK